MSNGKPAYNAADRKQIKEAGKTERQKRRDEIDDVRFLLQFKQFRRFAWRVLTFCKVFSSIWRPSAEIHHLSGKQDCGHFLMSEITESNPEAFLLMMKENREGEQNDADADEPGQQPESAGSEQSSGAAE